MSGLSILQRAPQTSVDFGYACISNNGCGVARIDAATGKYLDPSLRRLNQIGEDGSRLHRRWFPSGGKNPVGASEDDCVQRACGITDQVLRMIESSMKRDAERARQLH